MKTKGLNDGYGVIKRGQIHFACTRCNRRQISLERSFHTYNLRLLTYPRYGKCSGKYILLTTPIELSVEVAVVYGLGLLSILLIYN